WSLDARLSRPGVASPGPLTVNQEQPHRDRACPAARPACPWLSPRALAPWGGRGQAVVVSPRGRGVRPGRPKKPRPAGAGRGCAHHEAVNPGWATRFCRVAAPFIGGDAERLLRYSGSLAIGHGRP